MVAARERASEAGKSSYCIESGAAGGSGASEYALSAAVTDELKLSEARGELTGRLSVCPSV